MLSKAGTGNIDVFNELMPKIMVIANSYGQPEANGISSGITFLYNLLEHYFFLHALLCYA